MNIADVVSDCVVALYQQDMAMGMSPEAWTVELLGALLLNKLWYHYDTENGFCGFLQGFYIDKIPETQQQAIDRFRQNGGNRGNIGIIINCVIVHGKDTLWKLVKKLKKDNPDWEVVCWWRKKDNKRVCFFNRNRGGTRCRQTVEY